MNEIYKLSSFLVLILVLSCIFTNFLAVGFSTFVVILIYYFGWEYYSQDHTIGENIHSLYLKVRNLKSNDYWNINSEMHNSSGSNNSIWMSKNHVLAGTSKDSNISRRMEPTITSTPISYWQRKEQQMFTPTRIKPPSLSHTRYSLSDTNSMFESPKSSSCLKQNSPGPLLASTHFHNNVGTYMDSKSPGLSRRLVQYNSEREYKATHQSKYGRPGIFPIVHLFKKDKPNITAQPKKVTVRVATPDYSLLNNPEHRKLLLDGIVQDPIKSNSRSTESDGGTRSVLDALKEISRKRILASEGFDDMQETSKRQRREAAESSKDKRPREESPLKNASFSDIPSSKRACFVDSVTASYLSTSLTFENLDKGKKRKAADILQAKEKKISKCSDAVTQTSSDKQITNVPESGKVSEEKEKEPKEIIGEITKDEAKAPVLFKVFDDKSLEISRKNKLISLLSAFTGENPELLPYEDRVQAFTTNMNESGEVKKKLVSIISPQNKAKHDKHVTFNLPDETDSKTPEKAVAVPQEVGTIAAISYPQEKEISEQTPASVSYDEPISTEEPKSEQDILKQPTTPMFSFNIPNPITSPTVIATSTQEVARTKAIASAFEVQKSPTLFNFMQDPKVPDQKILNVPEQSIKTTSPSKIGGFKFNLNASSENTAQKSEEKLPQMSSPSFMFTNATTAFSNSNPLLSASTVGANTTNPSTIKSLTNPSTQFLPPPSSSSIFSSKLSSPIMSTISTRLSNPLATGSNPISSSVTSMSPFTPKTATFEFNTSSDTTSQPKPFGSFEFGKDVQAKVTNTEVSNSDMKKTFSFFNTNVASNANLTSAVTTTNMFSGTLTSSIFGNKSDVSCVTTPTTAAPIFGISSGTAVPTFGVVSTKPSSIFGVNTDTSVTSNISTSEFGVNVTGSSAPAFSGTSAFGPTTSTFSPITSAPTFAFGGDLKSLPALTFGTNNVTTSPSSFGSKNTNVTSMFTSTSTTANATPLFGASVTTPALTSGSNGTNAATPMFGPSAKSAPVFSFGSGPLSSSESKAENVAPPAAEFRVTTPNFGTSTAPAFNTQPLNFGGARTETTKQFGEVSAASTFSSLPQPQKTEGTSGFNNPFGGTTPSFGANTTASLFNTTISSSSPFVSTPVKPTNLFGNTLNNNSDNTFGKPLATNTAFGSSNNTFGTGTGTSAAFGSATPNVFGATSTNNETNAPFQQAGSTFSFGANNSAAASTAQNKMFSFGSNEVKPGGFNFNSGTSASLTFGASAPAPFATSNVNPAFGSGNAPPPFGTASTPAFGTGNAPNFGNSSTLNFMPQFNAPAAGTFSIGSGSAPTKQRTHIKAKRRT